jgi:hypothetical protein
METKINLRSKGWRKGTPFHQVTGESLKKGREPICSFNPKIIRKVDFSLDSQNNVTVSSVIIWMEGEKKSQDQFLEDLDGQKIDIVVKNNELSGNSDWVKLVHKTLQDEKMRAEKKEEIIAGNRDTLRGNRKGFAGPAKQKKEKNHPELPFQLQYDDLCGKNVTFYELVVPRLRNRKYLVEPLGCRCRKCTDTTKKEEKHHKSVLMSGDLTAE